MKNYYLYILASSKNGTLYIGVTGDLIKRIWQHKQKIVEGFTKKYNISMLVYFEEYPNPKEAIKREKNIKAWQRKWKISLIEKNNPNWNDLYDKIV
ncbi:MAG: GIY-YIG nuclease family protein [Patescibacteria group bacterium]|jgi:putative endonuclease